MVNLVQWNSTDKGASVVISNNGLTATVPTHINSVKANTGKSTGKWYWEIEMDTIANILVGVCNASAPMNSVIYSTQNTRLYYNANGNKYPENVAYGQSFATGVVVGVAVDLDSGALEFYHNGVSQGISHTNLTALGEIFPVVTGGSSTTATNKITANFGILPFKYSIPAGYEPYEKPIQRKMMFSDNNKVYALKSVDTWHETKMTANNAPFPLTALASSRYSTTYDYYRAFDGVDSTGWITANNILTGWVQLDFGMPTPVNKLTITPRPETLIASPRDFEVLGSHDGSNFVVISSFTGQTGWTNGEKRLFSFENNISYRYYRINVTKNDGYTGYVSIAEIQFGFENRIVQQIPSISKASFIQYGQEEKVNYLDSIIKDKEYVLQDVISEDVNGHWTTQLDRKPLSIKFD